MTLEEKNNIIIQLQDAPNVNSKIAKYDEGTQTYYSDEEIAIKKVPQPIIAAPVVTDTRSLDEIASALKDRLNEQKEVAQNIPQKGYGFSRHRKEKWNS